MAPVPGPRSQKKRRPRRLQEKRPPLVEEQILAWADAHHERTGDWPTKTSGRVHETLQETWCGINLALRRGGRGLPGGVTLAQLLLEKRGVRNHLNLPPLTEELILTWADAHQQQTGKWPVAHSGAVRDTPGETWRNLDAALQHGCRGLPGGDSLSRLLQRHGCAEKRQSGDSHDKQPSPPGGAAGLGVAVLALPR
jgi:hypothetical protein